MEDGLEKSIKDYETENAVTLEFEGAQERKQSVKQGQYGTSKPDRYSIRYSGLKKRTYIHDKTSTYINRKSVAKVFNAWDFSEFQGTPINYFCVINLQDPLEKCASTAFQEIRKKYADWLRGRSKKYDCKFKPTYVYSFENPNNNIHVNWCLHIPDELEDEFLEKLPNWVEIVQGPSSDTTICTSKIEYGVDSFKSTANYILKGIDPEFAEDYFLTKLQNTKGPQGDVFGKRAGFGPAIGVTAQKRAKFDPKKHRARRMERTEQ